MCRKSVLVLVLIVVESLVRNDLRDGKSLVIYDGDGDLTSLYKLLDEDLLVVRSRILDRSLKFIL